jgi:hypothetical protein
MQIPHFNDICGFEPVPAESQKFINIKAMKNAQNPK